MLEALRVDLIEKIEQERNSKVLVYVHDDSISYNHVPLIYNQLNKLGKVKNLDIFIFSQGGDPDAAYKVVKMCREHCERKLSAIVPFMAKSAATLLAIGTDEIVMGSPSELGPIDPQILDKSSETWGPTQSIRDCIDFLEHRFKETDDPQRTSYILMPILDKLNPFMIGKYERTVKMSKQYAEILLSSGMLKGFETEIINEATKKLTESYYSHGYAIDSKEAKEELHLNISYSEGVSWDTIWKLFLTYHFEMSDTPGYCRFIETKESIEDELKEQYQAKRDQDNRHPDQEQNDEN